MILALGLFGVELATYARAAPNSPFHELAESAAEQIVFHHAAIGDMAATVQRLMPAMVPYYIPFGGLACVLAGIVGGWMSRDSRPAWFALTPLLMLPGLPVTMLPWTIVIAPLWVLAALVGVLVVRMAIDRARPIGYTHNV